MARYLNSTEKNVAVMLGAFVTFLDDQLEIWTKIKRPMELVKYAKTTRTYADKALKEMLKPLDRTERTKVAVEAMKMRVVARYSDQAQREYEKIVKLESIVPVEKDDFFDVVAQAIAVCQLCTKLGTEADECNLKRIFIHHDIEPLNIEAPEGKCPYQYKEIEEIVKEKQEGEQLVKPKRLVCMPLLSNVPEPAHKDWKIVNCPSCGSECWESDLARAFLKKEGANSRGVCTMCALKEG